MIYGMYVSAAGALANSYRQDVVANNLANAETVAFKRDLAMLMARPTRSAETGGRRHTTALLEAMGGGISAHRTHTDFAPASLTKTDRPFDLALEGEGFFQVQDGSGRSYTRDGRFAVNDQNHLVTYTGGLAVLDEAGQPIVLDPAASDFAVNEAGLISQGANAVGRLGVVKFEDNSQLRKQGDNLYVMAGSQQARPVVSRVRQGCLESSGVNAIDQLTEMIRVQRMFQTNISALQMQDETLGLAVTRLASVG